MLAFFDESGHPHPNDSAKRPVCVAVCISTRSCRFISGRLHSRKRDLLGNEDLEIKANKLLNRSTFRRVTEKREFVEAFFDLIRGLPIIVFAIIMERPLQVPPIHQAYLPNQFRYLLQRCDLLAQREDSMLTVLFDGEARQYGGVVAKFSSFLHRSQEGRAMNNITDCPFFVDSSVTPGIQIADMAAGVIRIYRENALFRGVPPGDSFLSAIRRYYQILREKTVELTNASGIKRSGFYLMPERAHYFYGVEETAGFQGEVEAEEAQTPEKPESQA